LLAIRLAAEAGYRPYFVLNVETGRTHQKLSVVFDTTEQSLWISGDFRTMRAGSQADIESRFGKGAGIYLDQDLRRHPSPVAAYLLPANIRFGERVYLEDLIEDRVGSAWNQGDRHRAMSGFALWKGSRLELEQGEGDSPGPMILG
jgi:hypothetical protein